MKKKILSLAIAICMVATLLPSMVISAGAEETTNASETGTEYKIVYTFSTNAEGYTDGKAHGNENPIDNAIGFEDTKGMWSGFAEAADFNVQIKGGLYIPTTQTATWYALKIWVPVTNYYKVSFVKWGQANTNTTYGIGDVYLFKQTESTEKLDNTNINSVLIEGNKLFNDIDYVGTGTAVQAGTAINEYLVKGEYIVIFNATKANKNAANIDAYRQSPAFLILSTAGAENDHQKYFEAGGTNEGIDTPIYTGTVELDKTELTVGDEPAKATAKVYKLADGYNELKNVKHTKTLVEDESIITFESSNKNVATVDSDGNITAVGPGTTEITAMLTDGTYGSTVGATLTVIAPEAPEEDEQFTNEFTGENGYTEDENKAFTEAKTKANFYSAVVGGTVEMNETTLLKADTDVALGTQYSYTAPEKEGFIFRYWAKALTDEKLIVTRSATVKFMPTTETTNLVAVYEPENGATVTGESFYNANGQLLTDVKISAEKMPPLPSMTGYGTASAWVQYGTGTEFAEGADAPTENLMFVAKYAEPTETFAINVEGGSGTGNYTYGQEVSCKANVPDGMVFKCWTKTPVGGTAKIISLDEEYTFNAWESCTITAVFADEEPVFTGNKFSIILREMTEKVGGNTAYMAEFVGLEKAVEKGIQFGTKRVAMTTDAAQFTVVDDTTETDVTGYAILSDGTVIYDK